MDPLQNLDLFLQALLGAFTSGHWSLLAVLAIVGAVAAARAGLGRYVPFFKTDLGGTLLAFVGGFVGSVAVAFAAGTPLLATLVPALLATFAAQGGWTTVKRLGWPLILWLLRKLRIVTDPVGDAEKAGDEAVTKDPPNGAGGPREV